MDIPYNTEFYFDEYLREVPVSETEMLKAIDYLKDQSYNISDNDKLAKVYGLIGVYSRIANKIEESKRYLRFAVELNLKVGNSKSMFVNELRLAHTYQCESNFQHSNQLFGKLIEQAENHYPYNEYLDFTYQHAGKNLFDQMKYELALNYFKKALEIRLREENEDLIISTEFAIQVCCEKLDHFDSLKGKR